MINIRFDMCNHPWPPASADYTFLDLDYSGYHKNLIPLLFIICDWLETLMSSSMFKAYHSAMINNAVPDH